MSLLSKASGRLPVAWKVCASRGLSAWGDRIWDFSIGLFMHNLQGASLRLVATYGFVVSLTVILLGAAVGNWIDRSNRLPAARTFLLIQNACVAVCCVALAAFFWRQPTSERELWTDLVAAGVILVATIANLASVGSRIVVERDWIVVIAHGDHDSLANINVVFRTIDLTCLVTAPVLAGMLFDFASYQATAVFLACWSVASGFLEYYLLVQIYRENPDLAKKTINCTEDEEPGGGGFLQELRDNLECWRIYATHKVRNPGLGLSCLFMTVLGFDNITYGFCLQQCIPESALGLLVGVSAVVGVLGSLCFPVLRKVLGVPKTGLLGMGLLLAAATVSVTSIWLPGSPFQQSGGRAGRALLSSSPFDFDKTSLPGVIENRHDDCHVSSQTSVGALVAGIVLIRFGLWTADLSITQIMQEEVEERHRGAVNGVQQGLNSFMDTLKFVLVILLPTASTFGYLIIGTYAMYWLGTVFYATYVFRRDGDNDDDKDVDGRAYHSLDGKNVAAVPTTEGNEK